MLEGIGKPVRIKYIYNVYVYGKRAKKEKRKFGGSDSCTIILEIKRVAQMI